MSGLTPRQGIEFDIYVMDLCESINPLRESDLEDLSQELHEKIETAIQDYIYDSENLNIDNYNASY